ncbi:MAG: hypothetical protein ACK500_05460 [Flavobacteriales bacterium]|jgi:hypothetical protein
MRFANMIRLVAVIAFLAVTQSADAQKRPPRQKGGDVQTPENAVTREKANRAEKEAAYVQKRDYHSDLQDKNTRKRMKKNLKRAQKHSWGKEVPWYKRVFRKRHF